MQLIGCDAIPAIRHSHRAHVSDSWDDVPAYRNTHDTPQGRQDGMIALQAVYYGWAMCNRRSRIANLALPGIADYADFEGKRDATPRGDKYHALSHAEVSSNKKRLPGIGRTRHFLGFG